jgi:hypothetical protein
MKIAIAIKTKVPHQQDQLRGGRQDSILLRQVIANGSIYLGSYKEFKPICFSRNIRNQRVKVGKNGKDAIHLCDFEYQSHGRLKRTQQQVAVFGLHDSQSRQELAQAITINERYIAHVDREYWDASVIHHDIGRNPSFYFSQ